MKHSANMCIMIRFAVISPYNLRKNMWCLMNYINFINWNKYIYISFIKCLTLQILVTYMHGTWIWSSLCLHMFWDFVAIAHQQAMWWLPSKIYFFSNLCGFQFSKFSVLFKQTMYQNGKWNPSKAGGTSSAKTNSVACYLQILLPLVMLTFASI